MKLFNVVALQGLGSLPHPGGGLDGQVDAWSPGGRDDLPETGVVENA